MSDFKANRHKGIGIGGINCPCCNDFINDSKARRKLERKRNKETFRKMIEKQA